MDLDSLQAEVGEWTDRTFPSHYRPDGTPNPRGPVYHLADPEKGEAHELIEAYEAGGDVGEELADITILALAIAHLYGLSLCEEIKRKMERNRARRWGLPDESDICEHIKQGDTD